MVDSRALGIAEQVVATAAAAGGRVRVLGGIAVALRCPSARAPAPLARTYSDIDLVTDRESGPLLARTLEAAGYVPERRFNALHGHRRLIYDHPDGTHVDVFVDDFVMCHRLALAARLSVHDTTVPLADLMLTKLQVAELTEKDVTDSAALVLDHELTDDEDGINVRYISHLLGRDWGWWRTVSENLEALPAYAGKRLSEPAAGTVAARVDRLLAAIDTAPKSLRWKARAKAGERIPWRDDPEETR